MAQSEEPNETGQPDSTTTPKPPTTVEHLPDLPETEEKSKSVEDEEEDEEEEEEDEEEDEDEYEEDEEPPPMTREAKMRSDRNNMQNLLNRLSTDGVPVRVHDVIIKGNVKTKNSLIESEVESLKKATTLKELLQVAGVANARLQQLDIFDSVDITLDAGPPELPGTANVVVEVGEVKNLLTGDLGIFSRPEARSWSLEASVKLRNLLGYGDIWDGSLAYGWNQISEISAGVSLPRFKSLVTPVTARLSLLSQDWLKLSSYKERALGLSIGLVSSRNHDLAYNLSWRNLSDPSQMSSRAVRRVLGHSLLSAFKYTFKIDRRNSKLRPTRGFAFVSTSQLGGLLPDHRSLRFIRQEVDFRCAFPLGILNAAINFGVTTGVVFPWGIGSLSMSSYIPERFFLGGSSSQVCTLGGPMSLLGFKPKGLGPTEPRRQLQDPPAEEEAVAASGSYDFLGGDLAVTAFADLSFDMPLKFLRDAGIHGHAFACSGSLNNLTEASYREFSWSRFRDSFRSSAGFGLVVPTKLFRMEVNYCYILRKFELDKGKTGMQLSFSSPL